MHRFVHRFAAALALLGCLSATPPVTAFLHQHPEAVCDHEREFTGSGRGHQFKGPSASPGECRVCDQIASTSYALISVPPGIECRLDVDSDCFLPSDSQAARSRPFRLSGGTRAPPFA